MASQTENHMCPEAIQGRREDVLNIKTKSPFPCIVGESLLRCELGSWKTKWKNYLQGESKNVKR